MAEQTRCQSARSKRKADEVITLRSGRRKYKILREKSRP